MSPIIFVFIIIAAIILRLIAGSFDNSRVEEEIASRGGKLISQTLRPFGKGWFGEKNDRIYEIVYIDKDGNKHNAFVKTSMFSGVYFTDDRIIEYSNQRLSASNAERNDLEEENERLRKEVAELRDRLSRK